MAIDTRAVGSPGWWLFNLMQKLSKDRETYQVLDDYYCGKPPILSAYAKATQDAYRRLMHMSRMNFAELVVESVRERMNPNGFLLDNGDDKEGADLAWRYWQMNHLDADSLLVHRSMLSMGKAFVIVGYRNGVPFITPEDPREVIVACDPADRRKAIAALKVYVDPNFDTGVAYLYLPGVVYRATGPKAMATNYNNLLTEVTQSWSFEGSVATLDGVVPVVQFVNNPNNFNKGYGEFEKHLGLLDRISYSILNRLEIATMQAFKQRGIKGVPDTDAEGNEIDYSDIFSADPGAMWLLPEGSDIWESGQADLNGIISSIKADTQDLAAVTRTPLFYLTPEANNGSAEGASLAREGLIFKSKDRIRQTSESWEQVISLAFRFDGETDRANNIATEVLWDDPERFTLSERYDAASKAQAAGVPWRTVMSSVLQFTPTQIAEMEVERASDALQASALAAPVQGVPGVSPAAPSAVQAPLTTPTAEAPVTQ